MNKTRDAMNAQQHLPGIPEATGAGRAAPRKRKTATARHKRGGVPTASQTLGNDAFRHTHLKGSPAPGTGRTSRGGRRAPTPFWKRARLGAGILLLAGLVELVAAAMTAPKFAVDGVELVGLQATSEAEVRPLVASLVGQNWMRADVAGVTRAVEALPTVQAAHIERVFTVPPRLSLRVRVEERLPLVRIGAGALWWVADANGVPFRPAGEGDAALYAVTGPAFQPERVQVGQALPPAAWHAVTCLLGALEGES
jgi:hypothetical protein